MTEKIDELGVKLHEIRQVTGARCLSDGHSAAALIRSMNKAEKLEKIMQGIDEDLDSLEEDIARKDSVEKEKKMVEKKNKTYKRKISQAQLNQTNR